MKLSFKDETGIQLCSMEKQKVRKGLVLALWLSGKAISKNSKDMTE